MGAQPSSVVAADFNGDGRPDVAVANFSSDSISILLQNSDGTFQTAVNYGVSQPEFLQVGDVNNDGKLDLLVISGVNISVLLGNGNGSFQAQKVTAVSGGNCCLAVGDFNGDGKLDVAATVQLPQVGTYGVAVLLGNGDGTFQPAVSYPVNARPIALATADFNNDGKLDLLTASSSNSANGVSVLLGNGDGTFQTAINTSLPQSSTSGFSGLVVADFNQDGNLDIATSINYDLTLVLGNGNGTFQVQQPLSLLAMPLAAGDLNGDGKPDLVADGLGLEGGIESLTNNGDGTFTPTQYLALNGATVALYDLNGDQHLDLLLAVGSSLNTTASEDPGIVSIVSGNGDGSFAIFPSYVVEPGGELFGSGAMVAADFNGDGKIDVAAGVATFEKDPTYFAGLLLNSGAGFSPPTLTQLLGVTGELAIFVSPGAGDFNGDGKMDLAVGDGNIAIFLGNGNGTFQPEVDYGADTTGPIAVGDFNNDGKLDVLGIASGPSGLSVVPGNGDGTFGFPVNTIFGAVYGFAVGDFNRDGKLDAAALVQGQTALPQVTIFFGNGDGTFSSGPTYSFPFSPTAIASGDLNGDGIPDLVVAVSSGFNPYVAATVDVLLGNGDGTFQSPITTVAGSGISYIAVADFNLDGKADIAISNSGWGDISLLLGNGDGTFKAPMQFAVGGLASITGALAVADFDGNGSPDLAVANGFGITLLLSQGKSGSAALVSPTALAFGNQAVGQASAVQTVILSNTTSAALSVTGISVSGSQSGDYRQSNTCGTSLAAGAHCTISVTFSPQAAGLRNASIQVTDNAFNSPQSISLNGTGLAAPDFTFGIASGSSSSSTISAGGTATFGLALTPEGSFSGTVTFTCSVTPTATPAPICSVPASVSVSGSSAIAVTATVTTTAAMARITGGGRPSGNLPPSLWLTVWALALSGSCLLLLARRSRLVHAPMLVLALLIMAGCGGGGSGSASTAGAKGTPSGTYTATVTAASASLSHQAALTVIVQ